MVEGSGLGMLEAGWEAGGLALQKLGEVPVHPALPSPPTQSGAEDPPPHPRTSKKGALPTSLPRQGGIQGPLAYLPRLGPEFGADDGAFCTGVKVLTPDLPLPSV